MADAVVRLTVTQQAAQAGKAKRSQAGLRTPQPRAGEVEGLHRRSVNVAVGTDLDAQQLQRVPSRRLQDDHWLVADARQRADIGQTDVPPPAPVFPHAPQRPAWVGEVRAAAARRVQEQPVSGERPRAHRLEARARTERAVPHAVAGEGPVQRVAWESGGVRDLVQRGHRRLTRADRERRVAEIARQLHRAGDDFQLRVRARDAQAELRAHHCHDRVRRVNAQRAGWRLWFDLRRQRASDEAQLLAAREGGFRRGAELNHRARVQLQRRAISERQRGGCVGRQLQALAGHRLPARGVGLEFVPRFTRGNEPGWQFEARNRRGAARRGRTQLPDNQRKQDQHGHARHRRQPKDARPRQHQRLGPRAGAPQMHGVGQDALLEGCLGLALHHRQHRTAHMGSGGLVPERRAQRVFHAGLLHELPPQHRVAFRLRFEPDALHRRERPVEVGGQFLLGGHG